MNAFSGQHRTQAVILWAAALLLVLAEALRRLSGGSESILSRAIRFTVIALLECSAVGAMLLTVWRASEPYWPMIRGSE